jgi:glucose-1-phosphate cytidylyltransferase
VLDTGLNTMTGGRILRAKEHLQDEPFMLTYGDGVSDVDVDGLLKFHKQHGKTATITTVSLAQQKGVLQKDESGLITSFREKSEDDSAIINGGFMVLNPNIFDYITEGDATIFEQSPMLKLAGDKELMGFEHDGFWQCMDTQREKEKLESLWASGKAPWMRWNE